jgi:hypothetical protein
MFRSVTGSGIVKHIPHEAEHTNREVIMESKEEIIILDEGQEGTSVIGPQAFCCALGFAFFRLV